MTKKKFIAISALSVLFVSSWPYLLFAFILLEMNPSSWSPGERGLMGFLTGELFCVSWWICLRTYKDLKETFKQPKQ